MSIKDKIKLNNDERDLALARQILNAWSLSPEELLILLKDRTVLQIFLVTVLSNFFVVYFMTHNILLAVYLAVQNGILVIKSDMKQKLIQAKLIVAHSERYKKVEAQQRII